MSKFDGILSAKLNASDEAAAKAKPKASRTRKQIAPPVLPITNEAAKRVGKRSHPDYTQITAYLRKTTHEEVMRKIYKRQEFSELLEGLLTDWLKKQ